MGMSPIAAAVLAYLVGSIPFAVVVSRAMGLPDPRTYGSGNPGTTNVLRSGSKAAAVLTLAGDAAKGWLAVWSALRLELASETVAVVAVAVLIGHVFPVWLRFRGGKGVATAAGVLFALDLRAGLAVLVVWLTVVVVSRFSSLGALTAALFSPVAVYHFVGGGPVFYATCLMAAVLVWRHEPNIRKLLRGEESRIGDKKNDPPQESNSA
jgi:acyl phosphate:glycerol-3-phosphate acyltransferase